MEAQSIINKILNLKNMGEIEKVFKEADTDGGRGLDINQFCFAMKRILDNVSEEELTTLHMKIDANCNGTIHIGELTSFCFDRTYVSHFKKQIFPKPFKIIPVHCKRRVAALTFCPYGGVSDETPKKEGEIWPYVTGHYLSISTNGILTVWKDTFESKCALELCKLSKMLPFSHMKKMYVNDMVFIKELKQLAVSTTGRELLFYNYNEFPELKDFRVEYSLNVDYSVTMMNYWSDGTKGIFSYGNDDGRLLIFISHKIKENGLLNKKLTENPSLKDYPTYYINNMVKGHNKEHMCIRVPIFDGIFKQIRYIPSLDSFTVCSLSADRMALVSLCKQSDKITKKYLKSEDGKMFFNCVAYSDWSKCLVTGCLDGVLRVWNPAHLKFFVKELKGHKNPITHVMFNPKRKIFLSLSDDKQVCAWSDLCWQPLQTFQVEGIGKNKLSAAHYNTLNNELVVANENIGACLGYGTDVLQNSLTSHEKPLCNALYHSIFKQVVSVCQNGVVAVWDILTGEAVMKFKVSPDECVGLTAISFDGSKRRLITVSEEGIVKLWNFNTGKELNVLPLTVHKKVTCIVCTDDRVFISGRNSRIIYDLNVYENDYRFLEHEYLNDISSLDVHDTKLIAAASNGNIVIWETETSHAFLCLNINKSPQIQSLGLNYQGRAGFVCEIKTNTSTKEQNSKSDQKIICLKTRVATPSTATLLTSVNGCIYAWSVHPKGNIIATFRAINDKGGIITTMATDDTEKKLLTGDSTGRVCLWDIECFGHKTQTSKVPHENAPPLLHSWQAHPTGIVSVKCDPACTKIITAGLDCSVRLWTNTGCYIGLFGKDKMDAIQVSLEWKADQVQKMESPDILDKPDSPKMTETNRLYKYDYIPVDPYYELLEKECKAMEALSKKAKSLIEATEAYLQKQPRHSQNQFKRHTPQTPHLRDRTEHEHGQSSTLNYTRKTKFGRVYRNPQADTLEGGNVKPNTMTGKQGPKQTSKHVRFPSIQHKVQLTGHQTQLEPLPPRISLTMGGTDMKSSLHMQQSVGAVKQEQSTHSQTQFKPHPPQTPRLRDGTVHEHGQSSRKTKFGHVYRNPQADTLEGGILKTNTLPGKQGPKQTSKHVRFPSISHKVQLTGH